MLWQSTIQSNKNCTFNVLLNNTLTEKLYEMIRILTNLDYIELVGKLNIILHNLTFEHIIISKWITRYL